MQNHVKTQPVQMWQKPESAGSTKQFEKKETPSETEEEVETNDNLKNHRHLLHLIAINTLLGFEAPNFEPVCELEKGAFGSSGFCFSPMFYRPVGQSQKPKDCETLLVDNYRSKCRSQSQSTV